MEIISEHKLLMNCFAILLTLFFIIVAGWKIEDYIKFEKANEQIQNNYRNEILKEHAKHIDFITTVLIENNVDNATLEIINKRLKDENLKIAQ